jgi:hypothetical protein
MGTDSGNRRREKGCATKPFLRRGADPLHRLRDFLVEHVRIAQHRLDRAVVHRLLREFQVLEKSPARLLIFAAGFSFG